LAIVPSSCAVRLQWLAPKASLGGYHVFRRDPGADQFRQITSEPVRQTSYADTDVETDVVYWYAVRAISQRGALSEPTAPIEAVAKIIKEPIFVPVFASGAHGQFHGGQTLPGKVHGQARCEGGVLDLKQGGHVSFPRDGRFDLAQPLSVECWVWFDQPGRIPVVVCCGHWRQAGWFLQRLGNVWRWHVGGVDCDGGQPAENRWIHLAATYDGTTTRLFENGTQVAEQTGSFNTAPWTGDLHVGQYGQPAADFQVTGRMTGVKIYHRPLDPEEIAASAAVPPN
jgi:hypothetical protein